VAKVDVPTEELEYPCPKCGVYSKPYMYDRKGYAYCLCSNCGIQYRTSVKVSASFRRLCSQVASKPTRSPSYYTPQEKRVKEELDRLGLLEGVDYFHNHRVPNDTGSYYYPDFLLPKLRLLIEVSPSIWHTRWNREESENRKREFFRRLGFRILELDDRTLRSRESIREVLSDALVSLPGGD